MKTRLSRMLIVAFCLLLCLLLAALLVSCGQNERQAMDNSAPRATDSSEEDYGTYLANGFISTQVKSDGIGSQDGVPLECFMAGFYDYEKLVPIPTWSDLRFYDGSTEFRLDKRGRKQTLDMKTAILRTEGVWRAGSKELKGHIEILVSRANKHLGLIRAELEPNFDGTVSCVNPISNTKHLKSQEIIDSFKIGPLWYPNIVTGQYQTAYSHIPLAVSSVVLGQTADTKWPNTIPKPNDDGASLDIQRTSACCDLAAKRGKIITVCALVSIATGQKSNTIDARKAATRQLATALGFGPTGNTNIPSPDEVCAKVIDAHKAAWAKLWENDIVIDGPEDVKHAVQVCKFYLLESVREGSDWSIPPMGLSNNSFNGHVFWDADVWMFPALILQHPELARSIVDYRFKTLPGAMKNAVAAGYNGAQYAWESGSTGFEVAPAGIVYREERHINGDVALAQWQYYLATGDRKWLASRGFPVIKATADYWVSRAKFTNGRYEIHGVVPPDEMAEKVNNSVYTNVIAKMNMEFATMAARALGKSPDSRWAKVAKMMYVPVDQQGMKYIARDGYSGENIKQADPELVIYPLQYAHIPDKMVQLFNNTYTFYVSRVNKYGPAMSASVHAVIAARLGKRKEALADFTASYEPFLRGDYSMFNEKRSTIYKNYCFLTGASGPLQAVLYGFAGAKMDYFSKPGSGNALTFAPRLPDGWKSIELRGVKWQGKAFTVRVESDGKAKVINIAKGSELPD